MPANSKVKRLKQIIGNSLPLRE